MLKTIMAFVFALLTASAFAAVEANKATQAELEAVSGIGPAIAGKIIDERKKTPYKNWQDMVERVSGIGDGNAAKFSAGGLTVNGSSFSGAAPVAAKKDDKKAVAPAKAAPAKEEKAMAKDEPKMTKAEKKAAAKEEKPAAVAATADDKPSKKSKTGDKAQANQEAASKSAKSSKAAASKASK